ncbi:MAG: FHA domain-containing protein [Bacteriovoracaceae bacterium]
MYKLVAVAGKIRGQEFELQNGENVLGRDGGADIQIPIQGVSKKHFSITVTDDVAYIKDLGSSNGTFVNGKSTKRATVKNGDKIALPDVILQVVHVKEKKIVVKKRVKKEDDGPEDFLTPSAPPSNLGQRVLHLFKYKFMPIIHGINEEYEWRALIGIFITVFVIINVTLTILPILSDSKTLLLNEVARRGSQYADEISRTNYRALEQGKLDQVNTAFLENDESVDSYELFDLEGRIVSPISKRNEYINDPFSAEILNWAKGVTKKDSRKKLLEGGRIIGIGKKILAFNAKTGSTEPVGLIVIKFAPKSLVQEAANSSNAYFESLVTSFIVAVIFFGIVYYLTLRPIEEIKFQIEEAVRGKRRSVEGRLLMGELSSLKDTVNSIIQRWREASKSDQENEFMDEESDETYVAHLQEFLVGAGVPALVLNSNKELAAINQLGEDLTTIRQSTSIGESLLNCAREKGFAATIIELCDQSGNNAGTVQSGDYKIQGHEYEVHVVSLIGKDNFAKAFYVTLLREE